MSLDPRYLHERDLDNPHLDAYTLARVVEQRPDLAEKARKHPNFDAAYLYPTGQRSSTARPNARHDEQAFQTRYLTRADMSDPDLDAMALNQIIRERPGLASLAQQHPNFREPTWNEQRLLDQRYPSPEHTGTEQAETGQNSQGYSYGDTTADEAKVWLILLHIGTVVLPIIGPAIAWLVKKESPIIVAQARACLNWSISVMIYRMVLGAFGLLLLPAPVNSAFEVLESVPDAGSSLLWYFHVAFAIIGTLQAIKLQIWEYPLSIKFFSTGIAETDQNQQR